ncbi:unnamed protein product, partial [Oikopleura dioica]
LICVLMDIFMFLRQIERTVRWNKFWRRKIVHSFEAKERSFVYQNYCDTSIRHVRPEEYAQTYYKPNPKLLNDLQSCESRNIPWGIVFGEREIEEGIVLLRSIISRDEEKVTRSDLVKVLKEKLAV